jgi:RimJ/RimL family protein N-acetyltransferase
VERQNNGELYNGFTAVSREYRGRGLALAAKIKSMAFAKQQGAAYIRTNNHATNERMLAVNRKLGYQPEPGVYHIEKLISQ